MDNNSLLNSIKDTIIRNSSHDALSNLNEETITYGQLGEKIARFHILFKNSGLKPGDHVALCGKNSVNWAVAMLSVLTYGAVAVPLLHDFPPETVEHLVTHSDCRIFFVDPKLYSRLNSEKMPELEGAISLKDFSVILSCHDLKLKEAEDTLENDFKKRFPDGFKTTSLDFYHEKNDEIALINYTSGSTGMSKGVMLSYGNLLSNEVYAVENIPYLFPDDGTLCMLPLAHMFGLSIELLFPLLKGCHINFLGKIPAPSIILKAFAEVRPKLVIVVPLILEKIIKNKVFPELQKQPVKTLIKIPGIRNIIFSKIRKQLIDAFGGKVEQVIVGGAAFNPTVEAFLRKIKFPYTQGYGMTECAPLISYEVWNKNKLGSVGKAVDRMEYRIDSADPTEIPGEFWVRGANVMKGYYKNPEATDAVLKDGWMDTGDICQVDKDGNIYIRGRSKSMILGPSGQNIYPEEIEAKIDESPIVAESVVVERDGRLTALIYPDYEKTGALHLSENDIRQQLDRLIAEINSRSASYEKLAGYEIMKEEFEKTPKRSIKRYLYS